MPQPLAAKSKDAVLTVGVSFEKQFKINCISNYRLHIKTNVFPFAVLSGEESRQRLNVKQDAIDWDFLQGKQS